MKDSKQLQLIKKRKERSDKGRIILTERDLFGLHWTGEQYAVRLDQLQKLLGRVSRRETKEEKRITPATVKDLVARWERAGLVSVQKFLYRQPRWVSLTQAGITHLGLPYKMWEPNVTMLNHLYWVNTVRLYIEETHPLATWKSERELRFEKGKGGHPPDAEVDLEGETWAIEVEITKKKSTRLATIMRGLVGSKDYHAIQYFTLRHTEALVKSAVAQLPEPLRKKCVVDTLEDKV